MLKSLKIKDFALIEEVSVELTPGLNILTGETGAGKSILIDALNAVLGGKSGPSSIRVGAEKAVIEAEFQLTSQASAWLKLNELVDEDPENVIVTREIGRSGSRIRINGTLVNHTQAHQLKDQLLTVHAQHEARTLMTSQSQLGLLDSLGDAKHLKQMEQVKKVYLRHRELVAQMNELKISEEDRVRKLDFAKFQFAELTHAELVSPTEDEEITTKLNVLSNVQLLDSSATSAQGLLRGGDHSGDDERPAAELIQCALSEIEKASRVDDELNAVASLVSDGLAAIEEASDLLRRYRGKLEHDPEVLSICEARMSVLVSIKKKYGPALKDCIEFQEKLETEVDRLENATTVLFELEAEVSKLHEELLSLCLELSKSRRKLAEKLCRSIEQVIGELGMERCRFEISFEVLEDIAAHGHDRIDFMIAPNPGQPLMPLGKIASGGELSRIMLAVKSIFAEVDRVPTVIFDEIDTGMSGRVLQAMRDKLARLSGSHQILCITHQPIIAAVADNHIQVAKDQKHDTTVVRVACLSSEEQRLASLAAMASGSSEGETALNFARALINEGKVTRGVLS